MQRSTRTPQPKRTTRRLNKTPRMRHLRKRTNLFSILIGLKKIKP